MESKAKFSLAIAIILGGIFVPGLAAAAPFSPHAASPVQASPYNATEIGANITAYDSFYSLYIYAPQNTSAPMLQDFTISMNSPGNSTYTIRESGISIASGSFSWSKAIKENTTLSGLIAFTVVVSSEQANLQRNFTFILNIMAPVTYINYEHQKISIFAQFSATEFLEAFAAGGLIIYAFSKLFRHGYAKPAAKDQMKSRRLIKSG